MRLLMFALLLLFSLSGAFAQTTSPCGVVPTGMVCTVFLPSNQPILALDLPTYMQGWEQTVMNQSILSLVNQGDNSPTALSNEVAAVANAFCESVASTPVPGCASAATIAAVVTPIQQTLLMAANMVPASQWNASTFNPNAAFNLATAVQMAQAPSPTPPPSGPLVLLPCANVAGVSMCYAGSGVTNVTLNGFNYLGNPYPSGAVILYQGVFYHENVVQGLIGPQVWFTPLPSTALRFDPPTPTCYPCPDSNFTVQYSNLFTV